MKQKKLFLYTFLLLAITQLLHASLPASPQQKHTHPQPNNYTLTQKNTIDNTLQNINNQHTYQQDLKTITQHNNNIFLLAILTNENPTEHTKHTNEGQTTPTPKNTIYKKYLLTNTGLPDTNLHNTIHQLSYHIIQTQPTHIIPTLLQWLAISPEKYISHIAINTDICPPCKHILHNILHYTKKTTSHKKGCNNNTLHWQTIPTLAKQHINQHILQTQNPQDTFYILIEKLHQNIENKHITTLQQQLKQTQTQKLQLQQQLKQTQTQKLQLQQLIQKITNKHNQAKQQHTTLMPATNMLNIVRNTLGLQNENIASTLHNIALIYYQLNQQQDALKIWKKTLAIYYHTTGSQSLNYIKTLNNIGLILYNQHKYPQAISIFTQILTIYQKNQLKEPESTSILENIASICTYKKHYQHARNALEYLLNIQAQLLGTNHKTYLQTLEKLAKLHQTLHTYPQALNAYTQIINTYKKTNKTNTTQYAFILANIGIIYQKQKKHNQAMQHYQHALTIFAKTLGKQHRATQNTFSNIQTCKKAINNNQSAIHHKKPILSNTSPNPKKNLYS